VRLCEWLAALADGGRQTAATIRMYRSALSTNFVETTARSHSNGGATPSNPSTDPIVKRLLDGIERVKSKADQQRRIDHPKTDGISITQIRRMAAQSDTESDSLFITAASLAAVAGLRANELLGSRTYPERALTLAQFEFFVDEISLNPHGTRVPSTSLTAAPTHCLLRLLISKTNQTRKEQFTPIAEPSTLTRIWRLYKERITVPTATLMFQRQLDRPMRMHELIAFLQSRIDTPTRRLTSKCFRIGAASSILGAGHSSAAAAENSHWTPTSSMPLGTYAETAALRRRAIIGINRSMQ